METFRIKFDQTKNRIYLYLEGQLPVEELLKLKKEYRDAIQKCRPGFTVLTDLTNYIPGSSEAQKIHSDIAKMDDEADIRKIARVIGETPLGGMQVGRIVKIEAKYPSENFKTYEEAEEYLDSETD